MKSDLAQSQAERRKSARSPTKGWLLPVDLGVVTHALLRTKNVHFFAVHRKFRTSAPTNYLGLFNYTGN